jgi:Uncharacterized protein conserved in bacteria (DUF2188)
MGKKAPAVSVVRHGDGWAVRRDGAQRVSQTFATQAEAVAYGRPIARRDATEFRVQNVHGRWRESDSYGSDPTPPVDQEH